MKRALSPSTNATGLTAAAAALWALGWAIWNLAHNRVALDPQVVVAALAAVAALYARQKVTPMKDPRDGAGRRLAPADGQVILQMPRRVLPQEAADALKGARLAATGKPPGAGTPEPGTAQDACDTHSHSRTGECEPS